MPMLMVWALLVLYGMFAIYSVSIFNSFQLTLHMFNHPNNYFYFMSQLTHLFLAIILGIWVYFLPLDFIKKNSWKMFLASLLILFLVFTPLGLKFHWAKGWLYLPGLGSMQPGELVKLGFMMFFSWWLIKKQKILNTVGGYMTMLMVIWISLFVFLLIPDLGTLLILWPVVLMLYMYAWGKFKYMLMSIWLGILFSLTVWMHFNYMSKSVKYFLNPEIDKTVQWIWYQTSQWLMAMWAGGFWWEGYWKWLQKFWFIPEAQSDFMFAAFSEEVWFLGDSILLMLYFLLGRFSIKQLKYVKDLYYQYLAVGILSLILWQAFVNMWVNMKMIPLTWLTLPFVSYWWTALMVNMMELVLLYKILYKSN